MALFPASGNTIRGRVLASFPVNVEGEGGIQVVKENGVWTIAPKWEDLDLIDSADNVINKQVWTYDSVTGVYNRVRVPLIIDGINAVYRSFETIADLQAAEIPASVGAVLLLNYYAGDGVAHTRTRYASSGTGRVQSDDGDYWGVSDPYPNCKMFGAKGDGTTNDTAALLAFALLGGGRVPAGTYLTDTISPNNAFVLYLDPDATIKLRDGANGHSATIKCVVYMRHHNSKVIGGTLDFNRAGQDLSAYNTGGGSTGQWWFGLWVQGAPLAKLTGVEIDTKIINAMDFGLYAQLLDSPKVSAVIEDCGEGSQVLDCDNVIGGDIIARRIDDDGANVTCHAIDFTRSSGRFNSGVIEDQSSYRNFSDGAKSDWFTGFTFVGNTALAFNTLVAKAKDDDTMTKSLGSSFLGNERLTVGHTHIEGYTTSQLEWDGNIDSHIRGLYLDGKWQTSSKFPSEISTGIHSLGAGFYPDFVGRSLRTNVRCSIGPGTIKRCTSSALRVASQNDVLFHGISTPGCRDGLALDSFYPNSSLSFQGQDVTGGRNIKVAYCDFSWCERYGVVNAGSISVDLSTCTMNNNGQSRSMPTPGTLRGGGTFAGPSYGYFGGDDGITGSDTDPRVGVRMVGCETADTQTESGFGSFNPATPNVISVWQPGLYHVGQVVSIPNGASGPATLVTWITDISQDELTLADPLTNFPTVSLTGTFNSSGTALTGSGSALLSEVKGRGWVTNDAGTTVRLIRGVSTNTAGTLMTAFPSNLSGASLSLYRVAVEQVRSQGYGIGTSSATLDEVVATSHSFGPSGNVTENTNITGKASISPANWPELPCFLDVNDWLISNGSPAIALSSGFGVRAWKLDGAGATESIQALKRVPRGFKGKVRIRVLWFNDGAGAGDVVFRNRWANVADGATVDVSATVDGTTTVTALAQNLLVETVMPSITPTAENLFRVNIDRPSANAADTLTDDIGVIGAVLEIV